MTNELSIQIWNRFHRFSLLLHRARHQAHSGRDGRDPARGQGRALAHLSHMDGATMKEVAEALGIRAASLSEVMTRLEKAGMIKRQQSEDDRRSWRLFLTPRGAEAAKEATENWSRNLEELFEALDETEKEQLAGLMDKLVASLATRFGEELPEDDVRIHHHGHHHFHDDKDRKRHERFVREHLLEGMEDETGKAEEGGRRPKKSRSRGFRWPGSARLVLFPQDVLDFSDRRDPK